MDKKDQIILQQLEVIRSMSEKNLSQMNSDFWGSPAPSRPAAPKADDKNTAPTATSGGNDAPAKKEEALPRGAGQLHRPR